MIKNRFMVLLSLMFVSTALYSIDPCRACIAQKAFLKMSCDSSPVMLRNYSNWCLEIGYQASFATDPNFQKCSDILSELKPEGETTYKEFSQTSDPCTVCVNRSLVLAASCYSKNTSDSFCDKALPCAEAAIQFIEIHPYVVENF